MSVLLSGSDFLSETRRIVVKREAGAAQQRPAVVRSAFEAALARLPGYRRSYVRVVSIGAALLLNGLLFAVAVVFQPVSHQSSVAYEVNIRPSVATPEPDALMAEPEVVEKEPPPEETLAEPPAVVLDLPALKPMEDVPETVAVQPKAPEALLPPKTVAVDWVPPRVEVPNVVMNADVVQSNFFSEVHAAISSEVRYPPIARRGGLEGEVLLRLSIAWTGEVIAVRPSGRSASLLSKAALVAVERAAPLPVPPPELSAPVELSIPIAFRIEG